MLVVTQNCRITSLDDFRKSALILNSEFDIHYCFQHGIMVMAQTLKQEIIENILQTATRLFAAKGVRATSMADLAKEVGISTGNVYRYFPDKEALFYAVIPLKFVRKIEALLKRKILAAGVTDLGQTHQLVSAKFLEYCIVNRERIVILLSQAEGTKYSSIRCNFLNILLDFVKEYCRQTLPCKVLTENEILCLRRIYEACMDHFLAILRENVDPKVIHEQFSAYSCYHLAGMKAILTN